MEDVISSNLSILVWVILPALLTWEAIWKAIALWNAGRNNHLIWFIAIFVINSLGILPIIYLIILKKKEKKDFTVKISNFDKD